MMLRARIFMLLVALVCLAVIAMQVRRRHMRAKYLILWSSLGAGLLPLAIWPSLLQRVSTWVGIFYPPTTLFLVATIVLFLLNIHFSREISRLEERTRILAEEISLLRLESQADGAMQTTVTGVPGSGEAAR